jgi:hypothetical protein
MSDSIKVDNKSVADKKAPFLDILGRFGKFFLNDYHTFLIQKTERLASALYIVTGFINPEEPVRLKLRTCALDLITRTCDVNCLADAGADQFVARCAEIGTILETAIHAGLISPMNARLICDEYASLATFVKGNQGNITHSTAIGKNGTANGLSLKSPLENDRFVQENGYTVYKRQDGTLKKRQSDRRASILSLFKNRDRISIKDAVLSVVGYSEKTIQRELMSLVLDGALIKEGERRWTTYRKVAVNQNKL